MVLESLLSNLILSLGQASAQIGNRKICAALATYFIQFPDLWPDPIRHLVFCLREGRYVPPAEMANGPDLEVAISSLSQPAAEAVLWFTTILIEEVGKTDPKALRL